MDGAKTAGARAGYTYLHSAVDGLTQIAYTEAHDNETAATAIGFLYRARAYFKEHGITRVVTDNGTCYRAHAFGRTVRAFAARHQQIKPYTPKHNGKAERYQQTLARELLCTRPFASDGKRRAAIGTYLINYNYHRPHSAADDQPPASRAPAHATNVTNVMPSYS